MKHRLEFHGYGSDRIGLWQPHGTTARIRILRARIEGEGSLEARVATFSANANPFASTLKQAPREVGAPERELIPGALPAEVQTRPIEGIKGSIRGAVKERPGNIELGRGGESTLAELGPDQGLAIEILAHDGQPRWTLTVLWDETKPGEKEDAPSSVLPDSANPPPTDADQIAAIRDDPQTHPGSPYYPEKAGLPVGGGPIDAAERDQPTQSERPGNPVDSQAEAGESSGYAKDPQSKRRGR